MFLLRFNRIRVIFSLSILMGIFWTMELLSFAVDNSYTVWYIFDTLNILTGVFVFFLFVCKPKVWNLLKKRFRCSKVQSNNRTTSSQTSSSNISRIRRMTMSSDRQKQQQQVACSEDIAIELNSMMHPEAGQGEVIIETADEFPSSSQ